MAAKILFVLLAAFLQVNGAPWSFIKGPMDLASSTREDIMASPIQGALATPGKLLEAGMAMPGNVIGGIQTAVGDAADQVQGFLPNEIVSKVQEAISGDADLSGVIGNLLPEQLEQLISNVVEASPIHSLQDITTADGIKGVIQNIANAPEDMMKNAMIKLIKEAVQRAIAMVPVQEMKSAAAAQAESIKSGTQSFWEKAQAKMAGLKETASSKMADLKEQAGTTFSSVKESAQTKFAGIKEQAGNIVSGISEKFQGAQANAIAETEELLEEVKAGLLGNAEVMMAKINNKMASLAAEDGADVEAIQAQISEVNQISSDIIGRMISAQTPEEVDACRIEFLEIFGTMLEKL